MMTAIVARINDDDGRMEIAVGLRSWAAWWGRSAPRTVGDGPNDG